MHAQQVIGILLTLTALASYINYRFVKLPKSIGLTLITLALSLIIVIGSHIGLPLNNFAVSLLKGINFDKTFLHGMLGFLLFAGSLHVNSMELAKHKMLIALLATVSVALSTILIGYSMCAITSWLGIVIPKAYCFVFGALISPTDPIAVLGILKRVKASKSLEMKIAGEALFNDGMGIVLFMVIASIAAGDSETLSLTKVSMYFIQQGIGGLLLGAILGCLGVFLLKKVDDHEVAILITLALVTGGYVFAHEIMKVSGPICLAVAGLVIGGGGPLVCAGSSMSKECEQRLDGFWELTDEVLNAVLFVLIGLEFISIHFTSAILLAGILAIIVAVGARWISVMVPVVSLIIFKKFKPRIVTLMTWGGLRGGISIALALSLDPGPARNFIVSITYCVVIFSIVVQGLTIESLLRWLPMDSRSPEGLRTIKTTIVNNKLIEANLAKF